MMPLKDNRKKELFKEAALPSLKAHHAWFIHTESPTGGWLWYRPSISFSPNSLRRWKVLEQH